MEINSQFEAQVALRREESLVPTEEKAGRPQRRSVRSGEGKIYCPILESSHDSTRSQVTVTTMLSRLSVI